MYDSFFRPVLHVFPELASSLYLEELRQAVADCNSCLDIGCGTMSSLTLLGFDYIVGVESHYPILQKAIAAGTHHAFHHARAEDIAELFSAGQFDCVAALHLIECLPKDDGYRLISDMERIATKRVLIIMPNGLLKRESEDDDPQQQLSRWRPDEMRRLGFHVVGLSEPISVNGERGKLSVRPAAPWGVASKLMRRIYTPTRAEQAHALLCVKNVVHFG